MLTRTIVGLIGRRLLFPGCYVQNTTNETKPKKVNEAKTVENIKYEPILNQLVL